MTGEQAVLWSPAFATAEARTLCTDCGVSRSSEPKRCADACQFIKPDYEAAERRVHGRSREVSKEDERYFGPYQAMHTARLDSALHGAQWTGITTRIAERLLETGQVDAVLTVAPHEQDRWRPKPVIVTQASGMSECRGMRMGYSPLLALIEPALAAGHKRLAVIGIPCQVYALRALEEELVSSGQLEALHVIGTPCSDNTSTENFHLFLAALTDKPDDVSYLEFRTDYQVELRFDNAPTRLIPFLKLPLSDLPADFFPLTCRTCVDYTNVLADITVGYMGGNGDQWVIVRNDNGQALLDLLADEVTLTAPVSHGRRESSVRGFMANTARAAGGLPLRRMPNWLRTVVAWLMPRVGPRGIEFARARVEMKAVECVLLLRQFHPKRVINMIPAHIWAQVSRYDLAPLAGETDRTSKQSERTSSADGRGAVRSGAVRREQ